MCLCNSGIYCWGCVFLTAASPYKGANLSCAGRRQMMSCFLYFSLLSSCCRKAGLEVNISLCKGRAGSAASARAGWVLQEQNDGHGISGTSTPAWLGFSCCFPPRWAAQAHGMDGRQHSHPHSHPLPCSGGAGAQQGGALCPGTAPCPESAEHRLNWFSFQQESP